ncbi:hypothetical protein BMETH_517_2 [methanotrophic bacterial endosymbiont of Bathymodiolus sp.]|nr:hypothetical protein BMETH_517_2 [methanotrophic bacterial endosymbiont of Bathymodiolus sp.]
MVDRGFKPVGRISLVEIVTLSINSIRIILQRPIPSGSVARVVRSEECIVFR